MSKIIKATVAFLLLSLALILVGKIVLPNMGPKLFEKAVGQRLLANPLDEFEDGLHVILIGTGSPLADPTRAGPSTAILTGQSLYIVDSGGGAVRKMGELGVPPARVKATFLTHFHSDHFDGLGELMLQRWAGGSHKTPMPVYGPTGVERVIEGLNNAYAQDRDYRIAHHGEAVVPRSGFGGTAMPFEIGSTGIVFKDGDLIVTAFTVDHKPVAPAVGYRFDYKGRSVSITGDTAYDPTLIAKVKGSDLFISEALSPAMVGVMNKAATDAGAKNIAKIMSDILDYHISPEQAAEVAQAAEVDSLVFTHIVPALPTKALHKYFLGDAPSKFDGDITIGEDGMMFSLPPSDGVAKSTIIDKSRLN